MARLFGRRASRVTPPQKLHPRPVAEDGIRQPRGAIVMAILHPAAQGPLPKIAPLLIRALEDAGWSVRTTYWGGRRSNESLVEKAFVRSGELALALGRLLVRREAVLFVNSSHSWKGFVRDMPLLLAARFSGHGTVVLWHGSEPERVARRPYSAVGLASALLVRCADAMLVLSQREMSLLRPTLSHGRFFRVVNPYVPRDGWPGKAQGVPPTILFVGRVIKAKGVFELLEAFAALSAVRECRLVIAGDGPEAPAVRSWIDERGLESRIVMKGYVDDAGLAQCYADADVFVLPSHSEGFPTVVSEAMDAGLPIVTTRCGGMADHLEEGVNGLFVRAGDAGELEAALGHLLDRPEVRAAMGAANRLRVGEFAPGRVADGYVRALEFAVAAARRRSRIVRRGRRGAPSGSRRVP